MKPVNEPLGSMSRTVISLLIMSLFILVGVQDAFAQNTIRVPEDYATIQLAVNNATAGDTIRVGPGNWCGARITKTLNLIGEGNATIVGCAAGVPGPVGVLIRRGFHLNKEASGTAIRNFTFEGRGFSETNLSPLAIHISSNFFTDNVTIEQCRLLGGLGGIVANGNNWTISHNVIDGFTMLPSDSLLQPGLGGWGIVSESFGLPVYTGHVYAFNKITATVPNGDFAFASWINEVNVPFAGIIISGHDGTLLLNNKISITSNPGGDAGSGIIATDATVDGPSFTSLNLVIKNNDGRGSAYSLIIPKDQLFGTGNTVGAFIRGNLGVNRINDDTSNVRNRSIHTLRECDGGGTCP